MCVCSLTYSARNSLAPYFYMWSSRLYYIFPHYIINGGISEKKKLLNIKLVLSLQLLYDTILIRKITERYIIKNVQWSPCKVTAILPVRFQWNLNFADRFSKNTRFPNFKKPRPVGAELFHAERQAEIRTHWNDAANSRHSQFSESAPKKIHSRYPSVRGDAAINCETNRPNNTPHKSSN